MHRPWWFAAVFCILLLALIPLGNGLAQSGALPSTAVYLPIVFQGPPTATPTLSAPIVITQTATSTTAPLPQPSELYGGVDENVSRQSS